MTNKTIISLQIKLDPEKESETKSKPRGCRYPDARSIKLLFASEFSLVDIAKKIMSFPNYCTLFTFSSWAVYDELGGLNESRSISALELLEACRALTDEHRSLKFEMHEAGVAKRSFMRLRLNILEELANALRQAMTIVRC